jgi:glycosyltransferase involved in cell wall biosynthesis
MMRLRWRETHWRRRSRLPGVDESLAASRQSIYIDFTDVLEYARHHETVAGITRASLVIAGHLVEKHGPRAARLIAWHPTRATVFELESDWCKVGYEYDRKDFCVWFDLDRRAVRTIAGWAGAVYSGRPLRRRYHIARGHVMAALDNETFFRKRKIDLPWAIGKRLRPIHLKPGDVIIIIGATWNFDRYMDFLAEQKRAGVRIHVFVHDLVPLLMPEHVIDDVPDHFERWLGQMCDLASAFITNSESTKRDLGLRLASDGFYQPIHVVPLAQQFLTSLPKSTRAPKLRAAVQSDARLPFVLCVGTLESRKNPWGLARVWAALADELRFKVPRLVFAGKHGWLKADFDDLMRATGNLGGLIRIVEGPTEEELAFLYSKCLFTVFPSFYEGWGLPIGESLWFGKVCVASRISAMPEVGMDMCAYVDPHDLDELYAVLKRMIIDPDYRGGFEQRIVRSRLRSWAKVADDLWSVLVAADRPDSAK